MIISLNLSNKLHHHVISAIRSIHTAASELNIPFFVIGATARDIILQHGFDIAPMRATNDIDFAVQVENWDQFDLLKKKLIAEHHFTSTKEIHRLLSSEVVPVDIVPYGALADKHIISWPPGHHIKMSVEGFHECYQNSLGILLLDDPHIVVQIATLEGLALLKIISWDENPYLRNKDAIDLFIIMHHYVDAGNLERLYNESADLFELEGTPDYDEVSARFLGRTLATILKNSESTKSKVKHILNRESNTNRDKGLIQSIVISRSFPQYSYQQVEKLISALYQGLCEQCP